IIFMLPQILVQRGFELRQIFVFLFVQAVAAFVGYTACGFLIDRFGRRPVLFLYYFVGAFFHLWFAMASGVWIYFAIAAVGWVNPGVYGSNGIYVSELYPTHLRATAVGWFFGIGRIGSFLAPAVVGLMLQYGLGAYVLHTFALSFFIASIALWAVGIETKSRVLEQITATEQTAELTTGASRALLESEDPLPVVFHADDGPVFLFGLVIERLSESADLAGRQSLRRAVGIFAICVIVHDQHHQPRAIAGARVLEHLPVAVRIAKGRARSTANHQMNALGLARLVIVQEQFRLLREERLAVLVIAKLRAARGSDDLFGRHPVHLLAVNTNEILAAAGYNVRPETIGTQILHDLEHRLVDEFRVRTIPARVCGAGQPLLHLAFKVVHRHSGQRRREDFLKLRERQLRDGLAVAREDRLERLDVLELRILLDNGGNAIEAIDDLRIDRVLDPEC